MVDTDVVVLAISLFQSLQIEDLWVEFGMIKHQRWLLIHEYATNLGESIRNGLRFWFAFTGALLAQRDKMSWTVGRSHPDVKDTFEGMHLLFICVSIIRMSFCKTVNKIFI